MYIGTTKQQRQQREPPTPSSASNKDSRILGMPYEMIKSEQDDVPSPFRLRNVMAAFSLAFNLVWYVPLAWNPNTESVRKTATIPVLDHPTVPTLGEISSQISPFVPASMDAIQSQTTQLVPESVPFHQNRKALFVFHAGIEGTAHHMLVDLLRKSPFLTKNKEHRYIGALKEVSRAMAFTTRPCTENMKDISEEYEHFVKHLQEVEQLVAEYVASNEDLQKHTPIAVPLNAMFLERVVGDMYSYPTFMGACRKGNFPDLDLIYQACEAAKVNCGHVYLYRDPYDVMRSTGKRRFNEGVLDATRTYYSMLNIIFGQLAAFGPERTLGCWNLVRDKDTSKGVYDAEYFNTWESIRDLYWGEGNEQHFEKVFNESVKLRPPPEDVEVYHESIVPKNHAQAMKSMVRAHDRTLALCQRLAASETSVLTLARNESSS
jgi:hypothetical protein